MDILPELAKSVVDGDHERTAGLTSQAIEAGLPAKQILDDGLLSGMTTVGERFKVHEIFIPEVLMAAKAMKGGLEILKPHLSEGVSHSRGTVVIGTVKGDLHDIGKNLVAMMMEGAGLTVVDLGVDVEAEKFVEAAKDNNADVVALSALLTTTMPAMETTVSAIKEAGLSVKSIIGGAPVTEAFANQIGADGHSDDAPGAVELVRRLVGA